MLDPTKKKLRATSRHCKPSWNHFGARGPGIFALAGAEKKKTKGGKPKYFALGTKNGTFFSSSLLLRRYRRAQNEAPKMAPVFRTGN